MTDVDTALPTLKFRLPGTWYAIDPRDDAAARRAVEEISRAVAGQADDAAIARGRVRAALQDAVVAAQRAGAQALFLCREVAPGMPTPAALTVHVPEGMSMSPAIGDGADAVMAALEESFRLLAVPGLDTAHRLEIPGSLIVRLHTVTEQTIEQGGETAVQRRLDARYWCTMPGSKQVLLVDLSTPLGDIPGVMLGFFDAIIGAAYFDTSSR